MTPHVHEYRCSCGESCPHVAALRLIPIAARMVRFDGGCESGHKPGQWHMHAEPYHATGRQIASIARAALDGEQNARGGG